MPRTTDPFQPWNDPMLRTDPWMPWNDPVRRDDPFEEWNNPLGDWREMSDRDQAEVEKACWR